MNKYPVYPKKITADELISKTRTIVNLFPFRRSMKDCLNTKH